MQKTNIATTFAVVVLCLFGIAKSSDISFSAYVVFERFGVRVFVVTIECITDTHLYHKIISRKATLKCTFKYYEK